MHNIKIPFFKNRHSLNSFSLKHSQNGATLIVVLVILILVTSIGIIAIKNSNTSLKVSTAEQLSDLKFRANDAALLKVEKEDRSNSNNASLDRLKGYMTSSDVKNNEEVIFCLKSGNKDMFKLSEITVKREDGNVYSNRNNGYCDPSNSKHYMNEGRTLTQLTFVRQESEAIFGLEHDGTSSDDLATSSLNKSKCSTIKGHITTVIPAVSTASNSEIASCLTKGYDEGEDETNKQETVYSCLDELKVAHETQIQVYKNIPKGYRCV